MKRINLDNYFLPYQKAWILDKSPKKICEKSRRIGITWAASLEWVLDACNEPNEKSWWISRSQKTAREFVKYCRFWCRLVNIVADFTPPWVRDDKIQAECILFPNGHEIHVLSSNPDAIAGMGGKVGIDEYALHREQEKLYDVAKPATMWGDRFQIISTHRGHGQFWKFCCDARGSKAGWSHHRTTLPEAVDQGLAWHINVVRAQKGQVPLTDDEFVSSIKDDCRNEEAWQQEYMCVPADDANAVLDWDTIRSCVVDPVEILGQSESGRRFFGGDVGRTQNPSMFAVLELVKDVLKVRDYRYLEATEFQEQAAALDEMMKHCMRGAIDNKALGAQLAEDATKRWGDRFKGVALTGRHFRDELVGIMLKLFQARAILIPDDDRIVADLHAVKKEETPTHTRYYAEDEGEHGHADAFWAIALAAHCSGAHQTAGRGLLTQANTKARKKSLERLKRRTTAY